MKNKGNYYKYEIANSIRKGFEAADTIKEAREIIKESIIQDREAGANTTIQDYHIYRLDIKTGRRVREISIRGL